MDSGSIWSIVLTSLTLLAALGLAYRPLGDYIARIYTGQRDLAVERGTYRLIGVDPRSAQTWQAYLRSVLLFSFVGVVFVYAIMRLQAVLPLSLGFDSPGEALSFNTAVSFVTNTNWQSYSGEATLGYTVQFA
ncbi:MAG: potassium-transporting ATPase subunit, partial [Microbacterium sp.]|nr:potassium-transporting ATPase subunit [Microbacterium sp.]